MTRTSRDERHDLGTFQFSLRPRLIVSEEHVISGIVHIFVLAHEV